MAFPKYKTYEIAFIEFDVKDGTYILFDPDERLVATLKRHEYLSQPQLRRIGNSTHGRHRKPRTSLRHYTIGKPSSTISPRTGWTIISIPFTFNPEPIEPIKDAGIRAGEIIGHRCWWSTGEDLFSVYITSCKWKPHIPMNGSVGNGFGVHAYKTTDDLKSYADAMWYQEDFYAIPHRRLVRGTVAMWGEMVEHERGYRAEYAKIMSLDSPDDASLRFLRSKYGV